MSLGDEQQQREKQWKQRRQTPFALQNSSACRSPFDTFHHDIVHAHAAALTITLENGLYFSFFIMSASSAIQSLLSKLPTPPLWPTGAFIALILSPIIVPLFATAVVLSSPHYASAVDALTQVSVAALYITSPLSSPLAALSAAPAIIRFAVISAIQRHFPHTTRTRRFIASTLCAGVIVLHVLAYRSALFTPAHSNLLVIALIGDALTFISEWWIPSSLDALDEAEKALIAEMRIEHVTERGNVEGLSYIHIKSAKQTSTAVNVVMLHGYGAGKLFWFGQLTSSALTDSFNIYSVDLAGFGMSDPTPLNEWTPEAGQRYFVTALERWRRAMRLDNMVLLGHSYGGYIAACYGLAYPEYVNLLILVSPVGVPAPPPLSSPEYFRRISRIPQIWRIVISTLWNWRLTPASALAFAGPLGPFFVRHIVSFRFSKYVKYIRPEVISAYLYQINSGAGVGLATLSALILPGAWARQPISQLMLDRLTVPVDFIYGESDWMQPEEGQRLSALLNQRGLLSSFHRVSKAGHQLVVENSDEFNNIVIALINKMIARQQTQRHSLSNKRVNDNGSDDSDDLSETNGFVLL